MKLYLNIASEKLEDGIEKLLVVTLGVGIVAIGSLLYFMQSVIVGNGISYRRQWDKLSCHLEMNIANAPHKT